MSYPFVHTDGGRSTSKRSKARNDCAVRALAVAARVPYDTVYDALARVGRKSGRGVHTDVVGKAVLPGIRLVKESYPAEKGKPRMNIARFCREKRGAYVLRLSGHFVAVVDGVAHDDHQTYDERCVYGAYRVESL